LQLRVNSRVHLCANSGALWVTASVVNIAAFAWT
jgi:hypothetical protein